MNISLQVKLLSTSIQTLDAAAESAQKKKGKKSGPPQDRTERQL